MAKSLRPIVTMGGLYWMTPSQASLIFLSIIFTTLSGHISAILDVNTGTLFGRLDSRYLDIES